ncbi:hypothetical protein BBOV_I000160 [Babesia bovis T2Bo]|uniref:Uncharacterized protein n=1 Tax=Babesia bovis TaxID=5865 RepID=A7AX37_BABBO|nr:hypothetical protein BBOV_I000160 [Babesia bovis T2Bo]EDO05110.1 hypothetical protein BBOV_I000160 [Babesia bovis T2Bo]|eukprot:XP_001608678.1 hypothetical protein [Babesia bovis T2Bo]
MRPGTLFQLLLTIGFTAELIFGLNPLRRQYYVHSKRVTPEYTADVMSNVKIAKDSIPRYSFKCSGVLSKADVCYIHNSNYLNYQTGVLRNTNFTLWSNAKNVDDVFRTLCDSLKSKKTTFNDLQSRLVDAGLTLDGCKTPEDVVLRVAKLEVLGKDCLDHEIRKSDPNFQSIFDDIMDSNRVDYNRLDDMKKQEYMDDVKNYLKSKNINYDQKASDEELLELKSECESLEMLDYQLPRTKRDNEMSQRIDSYRDEASSIFAIYRKINDDRMRHYFISQVKGELESHSTDFKDCKKNEDYINRLAYSRVFRREVKEPKTSRRAPEASIKDNWNAIPIDDFDSLKAMFSLDDGNDIFNFNDGLFSNDSDVSELFGDEESMSGGFSMLKDIAKMFGVDLGKDKKRKIIFENEDGPNNNQIANSSDDTSNSVEEVDPKMQHIFAKVSQSGDQILQQMLSKCAKDQNLCAALKTAFDNGYEAARAAYTDNKPALYILEKFHERGIF